MIGVLDIDSRTPNLAIMKIARFYKRMGERVEFVRPGAKYSKVYISCLFSWNREKAEAISQTFDCEVEIGGTGWDIKKTLPADIQACPPDYDLYTPDILEKRIKGIMKKENIRKKAEELANMSLGFSSRGCVRNCKFCIVPCKEGKLRPETPINEIVNGRSNIITLMDNNLTADPECIDKLHEIRDRKLICDISQGIDIRLLDDEKAFALSEINHLRSIHYAWDLMAFEKPVLEGISLLKKYIKAYKHMCYVLCGFNTTFEEDLYRVRILKELSITPYIMKYNNRQDDTRLNHFARYVNGKFYKIMPFTYYKPWAKVNESLQISLDDLLFKNKAA